MFNCRIELQLKLLHLKLIQTCHYKYIFKNSTKTVLKHEIKKSKLKIRIKLETNNCLQLTVKHIHHVNWFELNALGAHAFMITVVHFLGWLELKLRHGSMFSLHTTGTTVNLYQHLWHAGQKQCALKNWNNLSSKSRQARETPVPWLFSSVVLKLEQTGGWETFSTLIPLTRLQWTYSGVFPVFACKHLG